MSIIQVRDLASLRHQTLIYFANTLPLKTLKESYTYQIPATFTRMVHDLRSFRVENFPIICYDDGDMGWASTAYCIFKAMNYDVLVLYGGLRACEEEGLELVTFTDVLIPNTEKTREIDVNLLQNHIFGTFSVKCLPFSIYEILGRDISVEKVKKLLDVHGVTINTSSNHVLSGPSASVLALFYVYFGSEFPPVYLGEWEILQNKGPRSTIPETFYSIAESEYYDAVENSEIDSPPRHESSSSIAVEHYKVPNIPANRSSVEYRIETSDSVQCRGCLLL